MEYQANIGSATVLTILYSRKFSASKHELVAGSALGNIVGSRLGGATFYFNRPFRLVHHVKQMWLPYPQPRVSANC